MYLALGPTEFTSRKTGVAWGVVENQGTHRRRGRGGSSKTQRTASQREVAGAWRSRVQRRLERLPWSNYTPNSLQGPPRYDALPLLRVKHNTAQQILGPLIHSIISDTRWPKSKKTVFKNFLLQASCWSECIPCAPMFPHLNWYHRTTKSNNLHRQDIY